MNSKGAMKRMLAMGEWMNKHSLVNVNHRKSYDSKSAVCCRKPVDSTDAEICRSTLKSDGDFNHRGDLQGVKEDMMKGNQGMCDSQMVSEVIARTVCGRKDKEMNVGWMVDTNGALILKDQDDVLSCWYDDKARRSSTYAVEFVLPIEISLAKEECWKLELVGVDSWKEQHGQHLEKLLVCAEISEYKFLMLFERDGVTYLARILQNFIFDPGG